MNADVEASASAKDEKEFAKPVALPKAPEKKPATNDSSQTCPWQPPEWAQECTSETAASYSLDVLKDGKIVDSITLKGLVVFRQMQMAQNTFTCRHQTAHGACWQTNRL